jgi:thiol:disulfide interchange protein
MPDFSVIVTVENYIIFTKTLHSNESQKWKSFSQNFQITSLKREKRFLLVFVDFDVKYCI